MKAITFIVLSLTAFACATTIKPPQTAHPTTKPLLSNNNDNNTTTTTTKINNNNLHSRFYPRKNSEYWSGIYFSNIHTRLEFHYPKTPHPQFKKFDPLKFQSWINTLSTFIHPFGASDVTRHRPLYLDHRDPFVWTVRGENGVPQGFYLEVQSARGESAHPEVREAFDYEKIAMVVGELRDWVFVGGKRHGVSLQIWDRTRSVRVPGERLVAWGHFRVVV